MILTLGPIEFRLASGDGWSSAEFALVTARKAGQAQRESCIRTAFKSEHLTELVGEEDTSDTFVAPDGQTYYGRTTPGLDGATHTITAQQVYARKAHAEVMRAAAKEANAKAAGVQPQASGNGTKPEPVAV